MSSVNSAHCLDGNPIFSSPFPFVRWNYFDNTDPCQREIDWTEVNKLSGVFLVSMRRGAVLGQSSVLNTQFHVCFLFVGYFYFVIIAWLSLYCAQKTR